MSDLPPDVGSASEVGMRRAYVVSIAIVWLFLAALWWLSEAFGPFLRMAVPALLVAIGLLLLGVAGRLLPVRMVGPLMLLIIVVTVFGRLVLWRLGIVPDVGDVGDSIVLVVYLATTFPIAFLVFGTRLGLRVSVVVYLAFVALYGNVILDVALDVALGRPTDPAGMVALTLAVVYAVLITTIRVLASRLVRLAAERARADMLAEQATTDPLTGIVNRRRLDDELDRLMAQSRRNGQPAVGDPDRSRPVQAGQRRVRPRDRRPGPDRNGSTPRRDRS